MFPSFSSLPSRGFAALLLLAPLAASAAQHWVAADNLRMRAGPGLEYPVTGTLGRGAELALLQAGEPDGFCLVDGDGRHGYVACKYLSPTRIERPRAGENGVSAAQRWISGNGVTLRAEPSPNAAVAGRLSLNAAVKLLRADAGSGYCEIQPEQGPSGYTACRYLAATPFVLARIRGDAGGPSPDYDPERAFALEPGWPALERYVEYLKARSPGIPQNGPWPRNDVLEKMKAHLALGLHGRKPPPYADWAALQHKAAQDLDLSGALGRLRSEGKAAPADVAQRGARAESVAEELQSAIGLWGGLHEASGNDGGAGRVIRLVRALALPAPQPSLFRSEADLAPPEASTEDASGRFGIVFRQLVSPRPVIKPAPGSSVEEIGNTPGLYDMLARTSVLVRPVQRVQLFRDGRLRTEASVLQKKETLWRDADESGCEGWKPGFAYGDADAAMWRNADPVVKTGHNPRGSLYAFYTTRALPRERASVIETPVKLDRGATGFVRGTYLHFDLDGDGVTDVAVFEGQGHGPGHLSGPTLTDDRWYRLALVNINGAWKVLGGDEFGYGCGC